jgi:RsiW-degrading membrane proteinase PrsW (M82 family)
MKRLEPNIFGPGAAARVRLISPIIAFLGCWVAGLALAVFGLGTENRLVLLLVGMTPAVLYLSFIMYLDRREPEPLELIVKLMLLGAISVLPALTLELGLGKLPFFAVRNGLDNLRVLFLKVAPVEEACKLFPALFYVWRSPDFSEENDGIVYIGASALGFAAVENILFVMAGGYNVGISRAFTALPLHTFTGVMMGYFVGTARFGEPRRVPRQILKGFGWAILVHGAYNAVVSPGSTAEWLLLPAVIGLFLAGALFLWHGRRLSRRRSRAARPGSEDCRNEPPSDGGGAYRGVWKIIASRFLIAASLGLWAVLVGLFRDGRLALKFDSLLALGTLVTFLPVLVGLLLEISYYHHHHRGNCPVAAATGPPERDGKETEG